jgi:aspartate kinase
LSEDKNMALLVKKFGGTSMADVIRINRAADIIEKDYKLGHQVVVVVSAMAGETDRLISLAQELQAIPEDREYSALVSTGEQVSTALLSMALLSRGIKALSMTGAQAGIQTSDDYCKARIEAVNSEALQSAIALEKVVVVAGFQGVNGKGEITTLGRGGSDTSAVALAASLQASECQIYTDVDGVYTTDPRVESQARRLDRVTFEEMLEMASLGAKVLQIRSVEFAGKYNVPLRVMSSFIDGPGTLISYEEKSMEHPIVSSIAFNRSEAKITLLDVPNQAGTSAKILQAVSEVGVGVDMIIQNTGDDGTTDFTFTINKEDYERTLDILAPLQTSLGLRDIVGNTKIAKLSLIGVGMRSHAGIATQMFTALAKEGIDIKLISTSEIKISVVIDEKYLELGVRALHSAFELDKEVVEEFDPVLTSQ